MAEDHTTHTGVDGKLAEELVAAARTGLGDLLRSVIYFTPAEFDVLYLRSDIYADEAEGREAKGQLVDFETVGFAEAPVRTAVAGSEPAGIGPYEFTVRVHRDGFVVRVIEGEGGVLLTTDAMDIGAFEEAATAARALLGGA